MDRSSIKAATADIKLAFKSEKFSANLLNGFIKCTRKPMLFIVCWNYQRNILLCRIKYRRTWDLRKLLPVKLIFLETECKEQRKLVRRKRFL